MTAANLPSVISAPLIKKPGRGLGLIVAGGILTVVWLGLLVTFVCLRWDKVVDLEPNAVGDFLAGAFAPLAFLWLVLGFFQQGIELRNSGQALWLQGQELQNSVEQQRELVAVTRAQLEFESDRITAEKEELRRNAQPILALTTSTASTTNGKVRQGFSLSNHGKSCTGVKITFSGSAKEIRWNSLKSGDAQPLSRVFIQGASENWIVYVSYLDERLKPGATAFDVEYNGEKFVITENPYLRKIEFFSKGE